MDFFDLQPGRDGRHYLLKNGQPIARFDSIAAAEAVRESFCQELIERFQARLEAELE